MPAAPGQWSLPPRLCCPIGLAFDLHVLRPAAAHPNFLQTRELDERPGVRLGGVLGGVLGVVLGGVLGGDWVVYWVVTE